MGERQTKQPTSLLIVIVPFPVARPPQTDRSTGSQHLAEQARRGAVL